jgi:hypothetical protein
VRAAAAPISLSLERQFTNLLLELAALFFPLLLPVKVCPTLLLELLLACCQSDGLFFEFVLAPADPLL